MRTNEPDPPPWKPLGSPIAKPASAPASPLWKPVPGSPGIEQHRDGQLRTDLPLPKGNP
jgi:hypothetical protein